MLLGHSILPLESSLKNAHHQRIMIVLHRFTERQLIDKVDFTN